MGATGILALYDIPAIRPKHSYTFGVLLEHIQDPGNLGSVLRTVCAAGAEAVFLSKECADAWSPKTLRAAMGAHFQIDIHENADLQQSARLFPTIIATSLEAKQSLYDLDLTGHLAFIFGNEGSGISNELLMMANQQITIPMPGHAESLNVAAASAICAFERVRQLEKL